MTIIAERKIEGRAVLAIDTGITARGFSQSKLPQALVSRGYILHPSGQVEEWIPEGTFCDTTGSKETMQVFGPNFSGTTLLAAISGNDRVLAWKCLYQSISLITRANISGEISPEFIASLSAAGPESILCAEDGRVLALPGEIYIRSIASREEKNVIENRLLWVHPDASVLKPQRALAFLAGTLAYRIVSGNAPFNPLQELPKDKDDGTAPEQIARNMRNGVFEPVELAVWSLRPAAASCINALVSAEVATSTDTLMAFGPEWASLLDPAKEGIPESKDFLARKRNLTKKRSAAVQRESFFRIYHHAFLIGGIIFAFVAILAGTWIHDMQSKPTTAGLSPDEVVLGFYRGIATLDQEIPDAYLAKGVRTDYKDFVTTLYVTAKVRQTYEKNFGIVSPVKLFVMLNPGNNAVYGITRLSIKKENATDHKAQYLVSFYLWIPQTAESAEGKYAAAAEKQQQKGGPAPAQLSIYRYQDLLTVEMGKKFWLITSFKPQERNLITSDAEQVFDSVKSDTAASQPWAPTPEEIKEEMKPAAQK